MGPYPRAVILAGGRGSRLGAWGEVLPKCLLPVFDRPLLLHQLAHCAAAGVAEVLVVTSSRFAPAIRSVLAASPPWPGLAVACAPEPAPRGPVAALLDVAAWTAGAPALMLLGDEYYEQRAPFAALAARPAAPGLLLGVVHHSPPARILCEAVMGPAGEIRELREKPAPSSLAGTTRWCGLAGFGPGLLATVPAGAAGRCTHCGDLLALLLARGTPAEALELPEIHLNLNTAEDALLASLVEARRSAAAGSWLRSAAASRAIDACIAALQPAAGAASAADAGGPAGEPLPPATPAAAGPTA